MVKSCFCRCEMYSDVCIEMKILILYSAIGSMATVDSALFSSSAIRVIKMVVLPLLYISLNGDLAKLRIERKIVPFSLFLKLNKKCKKKPQPERSGLQYY